MACRSLFYCQLTASRPVSLFPSWLDHATHPAPLSEQTQPYARTHSRTHTQTRGLDAMTSFALNADRKGQKHTHKKTQTQKKHKQLNAKKGTARLQHNIAKNTHTKAPHDLSAIKSKQGSKPASTNTHAREISTLRTPGMQNPAGQTERHEKHNKQNLQNTQKKNEHTKTKAPARQSYSTRHIIHRGCTHITKSPSKGNSQ